MPERLTNLGGPAMLEVGKGCLDNSSLVYDFSFYFSKGNCPIEGIILTQNNQPVLLTVIKRANSFYSESLPEDHGCTWPKQKLQCLLKLSTLRH